MSSFCDENELEGLNLTPSSPPISEQPIENNIYTDVEKPCISFESLFSVLFLGSKDNVKGNYNKYVLNSIKLLSLIPYNIINNEELIAKISREIYPILVEAKLKYPSKKLLVLDLDETLVHSDIDFSLDSSKTKYDSIVTFDSEYEKDVCVPVVLRPGLFDFLSWAYDNFILVIYTASDKEYADAILDYIEKDNKYFSLRLYRKHCFFVNPCLYIKNLRIFEELFDNKNIVIVDNSIYSFCAQINNGVLINSFFSDKSDDDLYNIKDYLELLKDCEDITLYNERNFGFGKLLEQEIGKNML